MTAGGSLIVETHFYRPTSEEHLLDLARTHQARLAQIYCQAPLPELKRRHAQRVASRRRPHIDLPFDHEDLPPEACWAPLALRAPLLLLDTTQAECFDRAVTWVKAQATPRFLES
ncbi:ATP-binding protein [Deinococcus taeanensis]|uniref:ATP-binding protein n=1 Tax=Deinococcus taeanensis TaxID=2737050 RepID=UPI0032E7FED8